MFPRIGLIVGISLVMLSSCGRPAPDVSFRNTVPLVSTGSIEQPDFTNEGMPEDTDSLEVATGSGASDHVTVLTGALLIGKNDAPVLTVYTDYACEYCREFSADHQPSMELAFIDTGIVALNLVYIPRDAAGMFMAKTAICAAKQGLFRSANREIAIRPIVGDKDLPAFSKKTGLTLKTLRTCIAEKSLDASIRQNTADARVAGISRIPAFTLGNASWIGLMEEDELARTITEALRHSGR